MVFDGQELENNVSTLQTIIRRCRLQSWFTSCSQGGSTLCVSGLVTVHWSKGGHCNSMESTVQSDTGKLMSSAQHLSLMLKKKGEKRMVGECLQSTYYALGPLQRLPVSPGHTPQRLSCLFSDEGAEAEDDMWALSPHTQFRSFQNVPLCSGT